MNAMKYAVKLKGKQEHGKPTIQDKNDKHSVYRKVMRGWKGHCCFIRNKAIKRV